MTVWPVLRDHWHERSPVLKDHIFLAEGSIFQCHWTSRAEPVTRTHLPWDHIFKPPLAVFQERFYCITKGIYMYIIPPPPPPNNSTLMTLFAWLARKLRPHLEASIGQRDRQVHLSCLYTMYSIITCTERDQSIVVKLFDHSRKGRDGH